MLRSSTFINQIGVAVKARARVVPRGTTVEIKFILSTGARLGLTYSRRIDRKFRRVLYIPFLPLRRMSIGVRWRQANPAVLTCI